MKRFEEHAKVSGSEVVYDTVISIVKNEKGLFTITTARKDVYTCDYVIYATGNAYRHL